MNASGFKQRLQRRRQGLALGILLAGLLVGLVLYATAAPPGDDLLAQQEQTKQYLRQMEEYGGTANVIATEIREWFVGLWQGSTLGITVACLSSLLALAVYLALTPLPQRGDDSKAG